jgi:carbon monoxide dehydrogenase subunit G
VELTNDFKVSVPIDTAWNTLTDVELIAPCLPGAELREVEGDEYRGVVKVKVGPITAEYRGKASFLEMDESGRRAVLRAEGREARGQGNASATITAELRAEGEATAVSVVTDLAITGRVAQFGRGVLADVSAKLLGQFVESLETTVLNAKEENPASAAGSHASAPDALTPTSRGGPASATGSSVTLSSDGASSGAARSQVRSLSPRPAEPVDLVDVAGSSVAQRVAPVVLQILVMVVVWRLWRRRRR